MLTSTGQLLLILILQVHTTSISIILTFFYPVITLDLTVSRCLAFLISYFLRGGLIGLNTGSLRNASSNNYYWSSTTYSNATDTYDLTFNNNNIVPSTYNSRFLGFSVRGGDIFLDTGSLRNASYNSNYWTSTTYPSATYAYRFHFNNTDVVPSHYNLRFLGFSVRGGYIYLVTGSLRDAGRSSLNWSTTTYPSTTDAYYFHFYSTNTYSSDYSYRFHGFSVRFLYAAGILL